MDSPQLTPKSGYCMNVHAGRTFSEVLANLENYSAQVQRLVGDPIGIGLWFSETSAVDALAIGHLEQLRETLIRLSLSPYTLNGFPQGDFHQKIVKHAVYQPTWWDPSRLEYTRKLVRILDAILPEGQSGSISTLPIAWGTPEPSRDQLVTASKNLLFLARELSLLKQSTGRQIVIAIEPEPGCYLTSTNSLHRFYREYLLPACSNESSRASVLEHITMCHDVCHAAVMFEDQAAELNALFNDGIRVGKVQVSSAIAVPWYTMSSEQREIAYTQLKQFAEDRYLHQTTVGGLDAKLSKSGEPVLSRLIEDLPIALNQGVGNAWLPSSSADVQRKPADLQREEWRVHFHIPIFVDKFGELSTTQSEIEKTLKILLPLAGKEQFPTGHFEIETYAWPVLPEGLRSLDLASGIAREIQWFTAKVLDLHH